MKGFDRKLRLDIVIILLLVDACLNQHGASVTVIAMTREVGSLGAEVAERVAAALSLKIIDSEIVATKVAARLGVTESAVQRYVDGSASLFGRWQINKRKLSQYTTEEILELCQQGNVLIRGWGAAALFRDVPRIISVRVCAPVAFRERILLERDATDAAVTRHEIERYDAAYLKTMRDSFGADRDDALLYHLVLNMARVPIDAAVKTVCELANNPFFQDEVSLRLALADKLLESRVSAALEQIPATMALSGIAVSAVNGKVTLTGTTSSGKLPATAEQIAREISGVTEIDNRIINVSNRGVPALPAIGLLSIRPSNAASHLLAAFRLGLKEAGYVEGQNVAIVPIRRE